MSLWGFLSKRSSENVITENSEDLPENANGEVLEELESDNESADESGSRDASDEDEGCTERCSTHQKEVILYFCPLHDCLGCSVCIMIDHRNCEGVIYIPKIAGELTHSEEFKEYENELDSLRNKTESVIKASEENIPKAEANCKEVIESIEKSKKEKIAELDDEESRMKTKATTCKDENLDRLGKLIKDASAAKDHVSDMLNDTENMVQGKQFCKMYIAMKETKTEISNLRESLEKLEKKNFVKTTKLTAEKRKLDLDESVNGVESSEEPGTSDGRVTIQAKRAKLIVAPPGEVQTKPEYVTDICIKSDTDQHIVCNIVGMVSLPDHRLVIADRKNCKVKLIDTMQKRIISEIHTSLSPQGLITISEKQIAVSLKTENAAACNKIMILRVERGLQVERLISYNVLFEGNIVYLNNNFLAIKSNSCQLAKLDMVGEDTSMTLDDYIFGTFSSLAVNQSLKSVYVITLEQPNSCTESYLLRKTTLDMDMTSLNALQNIVYSDLYQVKHMADHTGQVFLLEPKRVQIMDQEGSEPKCLLTEDDGVFSPTSLSIDQDTQKLYLGMKDNNYIKVFKLPVPC